MWRSFGDGCSIGKRGSENGFILRDEEHDNGVRITLEHDCKSAPFAITCGLYGWMVHTRFFNSLAEAERAHDEMKPALERITKAIPVHNDIDFEAKVRVAVRMMNEFIEQFP